jgi:hypothetical protein
LIRCFRIYLFFSDCGACFGKVAGFTAGQGSYWVVPIIPWITLMTCIQSGLNSSPDWYLTPQKEARIGLQLKITPDWAYFWKRTN